MINPITIEKSSVLDEVIVGDIITYDIKVTNTTGVVIVSAVVKDLLNGDLDFVDGSVTIDGFPSAQSILAGVEIGKLGITGISTVSFKAKVISKTGEYLKNQSTIVFKYIDPKDNLLKVETQISNTDQLLVEKAELSINKTALPSEVQLRDVISYRVILENVGTIELLNIILKDNISEATVLLEGETKVNGVVVNTGSVETGLNVGSLDPGQKLVVDYKAKVISGTCSGYIENEAFAIYNYSLENTATGTKETETVTAKVCVLVSTFKQQTLSKYITLPFSKPNIEEVDNVVVDVLIDDSYVVDTMKSESNEGQVLSGYKLIVHGRIKMSIEYTAMLPTQPMHSAHCEMPFSTFLILPPDYVKGSYVEVSSEMENVDVDLVDLRGAMVNIVFLVIAKIK